MEERRTAMRNLIITIALVLVALLVITSVTSEVYADRRGRGRVEIVTPRQVPRHVITSGWRSTSYHSPRYYPYYDRGWSYPDRYGYYAPRYYYSPFGIRIYWNW
jgi:hypothetical protein